MMFSHSNAYFNRPKANEKLLPSLRLQKKLKKTKQFKT